MRNIHHHNTLVKTSTTQPHISTYKTFIDSRDNPRLLQVTLKQSNTLTLLGEVCSCIYSTICPIKALLSYPAVRGSQAGPSSLQSRVEVSPAKFSAQLWTPSLFYLSWTTGTITPTTLGLGQPPLLHKP